MQAHAEAAAFIDRHRARPARCESALAGNMYLINSRTGQMKAEPSGFLAWLDWFLIHQTSRPVADLGRTDRDVGEFDLQGGQFGRAHRGLHQTVKRHIGFHSCGEGRATQQPRQPLGRSARDRTRRQKIEGSALRALRRRMRGLSGRHRLRERSVWHCRWTDGEPERAIPAVEPGLRPLSWSQPFFQLGNKH